MSILVERNRLMLFAGLLLTIGAYLAIDHPFDDRLTQHLASATQPQLTPTPVILKQVMLKNSAEY